VVEQHGAVEHHPHAALLIGNRLRHPQHQGVPLCRRCTGRASVCRDPGPRHELDILAAQILRREHFECVIGDPARRAISQRARFAAASGARGGLVEPLPGHPGEMQEGEPFVVAYLAQHSLDGGGVGFA
jgi:hypothetical protein